MTLARARPRLAGGMLTVAIVALGGVAVTAIPREAPPAAASAPLAHAAVIDARFRQGVLMLHAKRYEYAMAAFHEVLAYAPAMPEAHVDMGYALVGLGRFDEARAFFETATDLRPEQANAYYGLAIALEAAGDLRGALGAMRTYLHRVPAGDPYRRKAEAAVWEWEARLAPDGRDRGGRP